MRNLKPSTIEKWSLIWSIVVAAVAVVCTATACSPQASAPPSTSENDLKVKHKAYQPPKAPKAGQPCQFQYGQLAPMDFGVRVAATRDSLDATLQTCIGPGYRTLWSQNPMADTFEKLQAEVENGETLLCAVQECGKCSLTRHTRSAGVRLFATDAAGATRYLMETSQTRYSNDKPQTPYFRPMSFSLGEKLAWAASVQETPWSGAAR